MFKHSLKKINSLQNPLVKHLVKLRKEKSYREEMQSVLVMGTTVIQELLAHFSPKTILVEEGVLFKPQGHPFCHTSSEILKKITALSSYEGAIAEFEMPQPQSLAGKKFLLAFDALSDPGNLGTLLRSALSFGWEGVFLLPGCVDPFNDKALRASRGAIFSLPFCYGTFEDLNSLCQANHLEVLIADTKGMNIHSLSKPKNALLVLGNEAKGPSKCCCDLGNKITIPLENNVESLNVAVAGSILMYALKP